MPCRLVIYEPTPFQDLNIRIPIIIPFKWRRFTSRGSTLTRSHCAWFYGKVETELDRGKQLRGLGVDASACGDLGLLLEEDFRFGDLRFGLVVVCSTIQGRLL